MDSEQHRATADDWALIERMLHVVEFSCLLELRDRIEALEAAQPAKPNHPAKPDSSLVERVENAIYRSGNEPGFRAEARAAIRTVAAWMTTNPDHHFPPALVFALDKEAEHR